MPSPAHGSLPPTNKSLGPFVDACLTLESTSNSLPVTVCVSARHRALKTLSVTPKVEAGLRDKL